MLQITKFSTGFRASRLIGSSIITHVFLSPKESDIATTLVCVNIIGDNPLSVGIFTQSKLICGWLSKTNDVTFP